MIANNILDLGLSKEGVMEYCDQIEGHPDNVGASLYGGVTACCAYEDESEFPLSASFSNIPIVGNEKKVHTAIVPFAKDIKVVVVVPNFEVSTEKARAALPPTWPRGDVVSTLYYSHLLCPTLTSRMTTGIQSAKSSRIGVRPINSK